MIPKTLSASSALVYENCPARWKAEVYEKTPTVMGSAAALGTAVHATLESWVVEGHHEAKSPLPELLKIWDHEYSLLFTETERKDEGAEMLATWWARQDWTNRTVLSTERKETFPLSTSVGEIPFTYIWDRCDRVGDDIEVVDYKTIMQPISATKLRHSIQPKAYALAAHKKYPDAQQIWVTFDLLRHEAVSIRFTLDQIEETDKYLHDLAERIIADDCTTERLNPDCRWCIRRHECETLLAHAKSGGVMALTDPIKAADRRRELEYAKKGIEAAITDIDTFLLSYMEHNDILDLETETTRIRASAYSRRTVDTNAIARLLGEEIVTKYGTVSIKAVDALLKSGELNDVQKSQLKQIVRRTYGDPTIHVSAL